MDNESLDRIATALEKIAELMENKQRREVNEARRRQRTTKELVNKNRNK